MFTRREVDRSFRKFNDLTLDLQNAAFQTWDESLRHLIAHCQNDPVMKVVTEPLRTHPNVDLKGWYKEFESTGSGGGIGMYRYTLPTDDEERTALLYQFLVAISAQEIHTHSFCVHAYGSRGARDSVDSLNREIVAKFTREVAYRLQEVEAELGESREVESSALMRVFNYHGPVQNFHAPVQNIQGGVQNSIIAANSTVTDDKLTYNDASQLARAVKDLGENLNDVLEDHRKSVSGAFALLVKAIETDTLPKPVEGVTAVQAIGEGSPTGLQRLRGIIDNAAGSLLGEALKPLIALVLGAETGG